MDDTFYNWYKTQDADKTFEHLGVREIAFISFEAGRNSIPIQLPVSPTERWNKPEDLPEELTSFGGETIRLIIKYKFKNKTYVDIGHKTKYDWKVSGSPSSWNDEILGWMELPKP